MIVALSVLLTCQLIGEVLARGLGVPVPGPVLGLIILLMALMARRGLAALMPAEVNDGTLEAAAKALLAHLSLLFVPAGVGVIQRLDVLGQHALALGLALVLSSILGILASAMVFRWVARCLEKRV